MTGRLLTAATVAEMTTLSESTLYSWRSRGQGPLSFRLNGRVVWDEGEVLAWIERQRDETSRGEPS